MAPLGYSLYPRLSGEAFQEEGWEVNYWARGSLLSIKCLSILAQNIPSAPGLPRLRLDMRLTLPSSPLPPEWEAEFPSSPREREAFRSRSRQTLEFQIKEIRTNWHKIRTTRNFTAGLRRNPGRSLDWSWNMRRNCSSPLPERLPCRSDAGELAPSSAPN